MDSIRMRGSVSRPPFLRVFSLDSPLLGQHYIILYVLYLSHIFSLDSPLLDWVISSALQGCPYSRILSPSEDWDFCASTTIAKYGIEQSDSESSSSPIYTAPNTPSSSKWNSKDPEKFPMDSEPEDRVSRLESRLSEAREQARVQ